ncbi:claudin-4-like [Oreochromis aureus]|uniref:claudin-4-like n=1 Tax=Oreochromis aureus TaxID=47969 RepID=UPI0019531A01|nr:claudin-4-like [Oreochromis aureus]
MTTGLRQLLGLALATISFVGNIIICALPQWRATELLYEVDPFESNVTVSQMFFEGLWKFCVTTSSVLLTRCKRYEEIRVSISPDLKVARVLIVIIIGVFGILLGAAGSKFINFVSDERKRSKMAMASGVVCLIAGIFVLIPVCWTTTTIQNNFNNLLPHVSLKIELGTSLYIGWITTALLFLGGGLLSSSFICRDETD